MGEPEKGAAAAQPSSSGAPDAPMYEAEDEELRLALQMSMAVRE